MILGQRCAAPAAATPWLDRVVLLTAEATGYWTVVQRPRTANSEQKTAALPALANEIERIVEKPEGQVVPLKKVVAGP
jgi:hypothetical protein